jgi:hypothetical protein
MLGTEHLVQEGFATAAEVMPAAPIFSEQILAEIVCGWRFGWLALQLLGNRIPDEIRESDAPPMEARSQIGLQLRWQANGDGHRDRRLCITHM